jgi:hypothetical protein
MDVIGSFIYIYISLGSSTGHLHNAHAHVQRLVSVIKMATVRKVGTAEDQRSFVRFYG